MAYIIGFYNLSHFDTIIQPKPGGSEIVLKINPTIHSYFVQFKYTFANISRVDVISYLTFDWFPISREMGKNILLFPLRAFVVSIRFILVFLLRT